jgi:hypothetical protein
MSPITVPPSPPTNPRKTFAMSPITVPPSPPTNPHVTA